MPPKTTPTRDVTDLMGRRSLATIPKDQKSLLEAEGSWAVDMKDGPHGLSTAPGHVLQTLKEAFVRLNDKNEKEGQETHEVEEDEEDEEDEGQEEEEDEEDEEDREDKEDEGDQENKEDSKQMEDAEHLPTVNNGDAQNRPSPGSNPARSSNVPASSSERPIASSQERPAASSPERAIAWSSSPHRSEDDSEISDTSSLIDEAYESPLLAPLTQPLQADDAAAAPGPSSGISEPDDLEMEVPQAQENHEAPINRVATLIHTATPQEPTSNLTNTAFTTDTPPCAQPRVSSGPHIPIPTPDLSMVSTDPVHHRTRRMKPILFDEDGPNASGTPPIRLAPSTRMPSTRAQPEPSLQSSAPLSSAASTPYDDDMMERLPPMPPPHRYIREAAPQNRALGHQDEVNRLPHSNPEASHARQTPIGHLYKIQAAIDVLISKSGDPYSAFTATYPDYATVHSGNLLGFIEACCHLYELQEKRLIREYLLDDFIRAWSGYLKYALGGGPNHLSAIEWFNDLRGPILFNRMCVNKDNLDTILGAYPEEVARVKAAMNQGKQKELTPELEMVMEQDVEVVDLLDDDSIMDDGALEVRRDGRRSVSRAQKRPRAASSGDIPPPTRQAPTVPAPSRTAPAPPPPRPPIPRAVSSDQESDDFDYLPYPAKPSSAPKPQPQPQPQAESRSGSRSRSRSKAQQAQPQPQPQPEPQPKPEAIPQPQPRLQPKVHRSLPERQSPRRHPTTSAVVASPVSTTRRQPPKSSNPRTSPRPAADYLGNLVSNGRTTPSSSARSGSSKPRKRTAEERARLREHFRKKASTSSTSFIGGSIDN
ncbi:hypothetical protein GGI43DRAFT_414516 [Trichoderma evansii]